VMAIPAVRIWLIVRATAITSDIQLASVMEIPSLQQVRKKESHVLVRKISIRQSRYVKV
jgi:hypothetical protein